MYRSQHNQAAGRFKLSRYFKNGEAGFLNQLLLPSTVFTTDGGSTAVSASGDSVGRIDNLISSGTPDLTQATAGSRPTWARIPRGGRRNRLANNASVGAGTGTPGSLPSGWAADTGGGGLSRQVVAFNTDSDGDIDIRFFGTTSASSYYTIGFSSGTLITAANGETWASQFGVKLVAGSMANITSGAVACGTNENTSGGVYVTGGIGSVVVPNSVTQTVSVIRTLSGGGTVARVQSYLYFAYASGVAIDVTLRITRPQVEKSSVLTAVQLVSSDFDVTESGVPSIWIPYYDGGDYLTTGVQSFGGASFFADAGQAWWVAGAFSSFSSGLLIAKAASGTGGDSTMLVNLVSGGTVRCRLRGGLTDPASGATDGRLHAWLMAWNGSAATFYFDGAAGVSMTVGAAVEEATNIVVGARTDSLPAGHLTGYNHILGFGNRALTSSEQAQLMAWMRNYYGTP